MVYFCFNWGCTPDKLFWRGSVGYLPERSVRYGRGAHIEVIGDVAQLARALDWQSRGRGFESLLLHK